MTITIEAVDEPSSEVLEALGRLLPQLNPALAAPSLELLTRVVQDPAVVLLVAREEEHIVGTATVAVVPIPSRVVAHVNDVVVAEEARGGGAGRALMQAAISTARARGATVVRLTSAEHRAAAHHLYESLGFRLAGSRAYRLDL